MRKTTFLSLLCLLFSTILSAQNLSLYKELVAQAEEAYEKGNYTESTHKYSEAFVAFGNKGYLTDRYNAGCSYALIGASDSAFVQLYKIANHGNYMDYDRMVSDEDLESLHESPRWNELVELVRVTKEKAEANLDRPLMAMLEEMHETDQKYRRQIDPVIEEHGRDSKELQALWDTIGRQDSINLEQVEQILNERGWLGVDVVGSKGNSTLFLVIQHSNQQTQEKYLPMMRDAVKNGKAAPGSLALLEDRVALGQGKKQIYGSQLSWDSVKEVYYVDDLEDPDHVDERRTAIGMSPLQDYVQLWDLNWDVEAYKKDMAEREARK